MKKAATPLLLSVLLFAASCSENKGSAQKQDKDKSSIETAIDGFTGKTAVEAGQKAKKQIETISAKKNKDLSEALE